MLDLHRHLEVGWLHGTRLARVSRYAIAVNHDESACGVGAWPDGAVGPGEPPPCLTFAATADGCSTGEVAEDGGVTTRAWRFAGAGSEATAPR